jgi:putative (di)nucleoside polyphosphate hydrolase
MAATTGNFRPNALAVIRNRAGEVLWCERIERPGAWQFPQGGIDPGETPEVAARREAEEEVGLPHAGFALRQVAGPFTYLYPPEVRRLKSHDGQQQWWCLLDYAGDPDAVDLATQHPEFRAYRWLSPDRLDLTALPAFKQAVYAQGLAALGLRR